jgi:hypothetical protein
MENLPVTTVQSVLRHLAANNHDASQPGITKLFGVEHPAMYKNLSITGDPYSKVPFVSLESHIPLLRGGAVRVNSETTGILRKNAGLGNEWSENNQTHGIQAVSSPYKMLDHSWSDNPETPLYYYGNADYWHDMTEKGDVLHERFGRDGTILHERGKHVNEHIADLQGHTVSHSPEEYQEFLQHLGAGSHTKSLDEGVMRQPDGSYSSMSFSDMLPDDPSKLSLPLHGIHVVTKLIDNNRKYQTQHYAYEPDSEKLTRVL